MSQFALHNTHYRLVNPALSGFLLMFYHVSMMVSLEHLSQLTLNISFL